MACFCRVIRSQQTYVFPIHLSEEIVPAAVFYATITPVIVWFFVKKSIIDPMLTERKNIEIEKTKRTNEQRMTLKRQEANAAVDLMQHTYQRIVKEETDSQGLVITKATYGQVMENDENKFVDDASIDVTIPLQCLVKDGSLHLYNSSKVIARCYV